eukprot:COSAG01_NODE_504_length_16140_cov_40.890967_10_plen_180_part_00
MTDRESKQRTQLARQRRVVDHVLVLEALFAGSHATRPVLREHRRLGLPQSCCRCLLRAALRFAVLRDRSDRGLELGDQVFPAARACPVRPCPSIPQGAQDVAQGTPSPGDTSGDIECSSGPPAPLTPSRNCGVSPAFSASSARSHSRDSMAISPAYQYTPEHTQAAAASHSWPPCVHKR